MTDGRNSSSFVVLVVRFSSDDWRLGIWGRGEGIGRRGKKECIVAFMIRAIDTIGAMALEGGNFDSKIQRF